jgi:hypothetical protein
MIKGFSEETQPLTEYERKVILPIILEGLKTKIGKANAVTNKYIISRLRDSYKIDAARLRKIINHIRTNDLLPGLIATSRKVYFLATTESELLEYEESLKGREEAIKAVRLSIARQRRILYEDAHKPKQGTLF